MLAALRRICASLSEHDNRPAPSAATTAGQSTNAIGRAIDEALSDLDELANEIATVQPALMADQQPNSRLSSTDPRRSRAAPPPGPRCR
jgi:hypothetical protein